MWRAETARRTVLVGLALTLSSIGCSSGDAQEQDAERDAEADTASDSGSDSDAELTDTDSSETGDAGMTRLEIPAFDTAVDVPYCEVDTVEVERWMADLSLREQIGQHVLTGLARSGSGLSDQSAAALADYAMGGVFVPPGTGIALGNPGLTFRFIIAAQALANETTGIPLFVALDQEGGPNAAVNSLTGGTDTIGSLPIGATVNPQVAFEEFDLMAREIRALGFNMNFGPVVDTLRSTRNGNLNTRSFGPNPELNAVLGQAAVLAMQRNLVLPMAKHFAGDGLSDGNPHTERVTVEVSREVLDDVLLRPFAAAIDVGLDGVMTMPAAFAAIDPDRAALASRAVTTDLLRGELGFEGLVITDALGMEGVRIGMEDDDVPGLEALLAGADLLLYVTPDEPTLEVLYAAIEAALETGELDRAEFDASTRAILAMKQRYCLFETTAESEESALARLGLDEDRQMVAQHAEQAIVVLENDGVLPIAMDASVVYVGPGTVFQDAGSGWLNGVDQTFGDAMRSAGGDVTDALWTIIPNAPQIYEVATRAIASTEPDLVVIGTVQGRFSFEQQQIVEWLLASVEVPIVHIILGVPFDYFQTRGRVSAAVALMGSRGPMVEAGARVLYGLSEAGGSMLYELGQEDGAVQVGDPTPAEDLTVDRCETEDIDCSAQGLCVDTGAEFGCVCYANWRPTRDGLDCEPDGTGG